MNKLIILKAFVVAVMLVVSVSACPPMRQVDDEDRRYLPTEYDEEDRRYLPTGYETSGEDELGYDPPAELRRRRTRRPRPLRRITKRPDEMIININNTIHSYDDEDYEQ